MRLGILGICVMHIVCRHQFNACLFTHPHQTCINGLLIRDSMILQFQKEIAFSKTFFIFTGSLFCLLIKTTHQVALPLPGKTGT